MRGLFDTTKLGGLRLRNRFIRSATWEGLADADGSPSPRLLGMSADLAAGGVGLVITGHAYVERRGRVSPSQLGVDDDGRLPGLTDLVRATHDAGAPIALQLAHGGCFAAAEANGSRAVGPSAYRDADGYDAAALSADDIGALVAAFSRAAERARTAGFDAVQIHAAHGYLLSQFLSPHFNRRNDAYGGDVDRRARVLLEVLAGVREAVEPGLPVFVKLNSEDFLPDGLSIGDMLRTASLLEAAGVDAIELSGGTRLSGSLWFCRSGQAKDLRAATAEGGGGADDKGGASEAYYEAAARRFKASVAVPLILVGGIRCYETAARLVEDGVTDYVALSRPLIREPSLVARWWHGDRRPSTCRSDNACFVPARDGRGLLCVTAAAERSVDD